MSNDTKAYRKDKSPFTSEDNKEAILKAFELFGLCMAASPCNNCIFFDRNSPKNHCAIGFPNSWNLFDSDTKNGKKNREIVIKAIKKRNEVERDTRCDLCDNRGECEDYLIDCTRYEDTRRHVINGMGHICPKRYKGEKR